MHIMRTDVYNCKIYTQSIYINSSLLLLLFYCSQHWICTYLKGHYRENMTFYKKWRMCMLSSVQLRPVCNIRCMYAVINSLIASYWEQCVVYDWGYLLQQNRAMLWVFCVNLTLLEAVHYVVVLCFLQLLAKEVNRLRLFRRRQNVAYSSPQVCF